MKERCNNMKLLDKILTSLLGERGTKVKTPHEEMREALKPRKERKIPAPPASVAKVKRIR
jgi:hypothetical protein